MGTQQILLIVLSIVIVGIAIWAGIQIYKGMIESSARTATISDLTNFRAITRAYYLTASIQGGSSHASNGWDAASIAEYIGIGYDGSTGLETQNATIEVSLEGSSSEKVVFLATPKEGQITYKIKLTYNINDNSVLIAEI